MLSCSPTRQTEILKIVGQYESMVKLEVSIDTRVHSMIIGKGGRSIRKIMEDYKVDIRLPRDGDEDPTKVVVSGDQVNGFEHRHVGPPS